MTYIAGGPSSIEYWRPHVDILTYEDTLIHYSAVLYLTSSEEDFTGGSFNRIETAQGPYGEEFSEGNAPTNALNKILPTRNSLGKFGYIFVF